jgi:hypothetical protein
MVPARVHVELTLGMGVQVRTRLVSVLMSIAALVGLPGLEESEALAWCSHSR